MSDRSIPGAGRRLRVLFIAPHFAEYALALARGLSAQVDVDAGFDGRNLAAEIRDPAEVRAGPHLRIFTFQTRKIYWRALAWVQILARCLLRWPDVIHVQECSNQLTGISPLLARFVAPVVLTVHDPLPHVGRDADSFSRWRMQLGVRKAAALSFVHGDFCRGELASPPAGAVDHIALTRHGVILIPRPEERRAPEPGRLLMFGRMEAYKGLGVLVEACERLNAAGVDFALTVAGRGPEVERLRARMAALPQLELMDGWITPDEVIRQFQRASIVALPYLEATQSGVLAGAFANGRPVVASRVGGIPDVVRDGETGVLVPPGDPQALSDAIAALLQDPARLTRMGEAAETYASRDLDWNAIAKEMVPLYADLVRRRRSR